MLWFEVGQALPAGRSRNSGARRLEMEMRNGGGFRLIAFLLLVGVVAALTAGAYSAGFVAGSGATATNTSPWIYGGAFGASGIVGLVVTVIILVAIWRVIRFGFWRHSFRDWDPAGPGGPGAPFGPGGPEGWGRHGERWQAARRQAFEEWHRQAHGTEPPAAGPAGGAAG